MFLIFEDAYNIYQTLSKFVEQKLPIKLSYKIMKILSSLENEINFYKDRLQKLLDEYAEKDENGNFILINDDGTGIKIKQEFLETFNKEYDELHTLEIEVANGMFSLEELELLELTPKDLYALQPILEEEEE